MPPPQVGNGVLEGVPAPRWGDAPSPGGQPVPRGGDPKAGAFPHKLWLSACSSAIVSAMKRIFLPLLTGMWLLNAGIASAHPLADKARAIEEQALLLQQRMGAPEGTQLTWGQQMAADDMNRLATAAGTAASALAPDDVDLEDVRKEVTELQVAGNRVRMTLSVANLDEEGRKIGENMVGQVKEFEESALAERTERYSRRVSSSRPSVGLGVGFGSYWGSPWGYPGYWSSPFFYRGFGVRSGFGFGRGFRCR